MPSEVIIYYKLSDSNYDIVTTGNDPIYIGNIIPYIILMPYLVILFASLFALFRMASTWPHGSLFFDRAAGNANVRSKSEIYYKNAILLIFSKIYPFLAWVSLAHMNGLDLLQIMIDFQSLHNVIIDVFVDQKLSSVIHSKQDTEKHALENLDIDPSKNYILSYDRRHISWHDWLMGDSLCVLFQDFATCAVTACNKQAYNSISSYFKHI
ncbi:hypothetical protein ACJX0J_035203 [Zea mays]